MADVAIAITAMPERRWLAERTVRILPDHAFIHEAPELGFTDGHLAAWDALFDTGARWAILLEEDARLCQHFYPKACERIRLAHNQGWRFVSFFSNRREDLDLLDEGKRWKVHKEHYYDLATAMRADFYAAFRDWFDEHRDEVDAEGEALDYALQMFLKDRDEQVAVTLPNLVDHATQYPSLLDHTSHKGNNYRMSRTYADDAE